MALTKTTFRQKCLDKIKNSSKHNRLYKNQKINSQLFEELKKIKRIIQKQNASAPHEILLVLDATFGQNALIQAKQFQEAIGVSGICLTKLDGTAKGGIIFAIAQTTKIPIRFIGVGEGIEDLKIFNAKEFVEALF